MESGWGVQAKTTQMPFLLAEVLTVIYKALTLSFMSVYAG